jgi:hypothetical protein
MSTESSILFDDRHRRAFSEVFGNDYMDRFTDPVVFREAEFYSPPVWQEYRQNYKVLSRNLFAEIVYRRRRGFNEEILTNYIQISATKLDAIQKLLTGKRDRLREVVTANGHQVDAGYLHSRKFMVPIIHSHMMQFLKILQLQDEVLQLTGTCSLNGLLSAEERKKEEVQTKAAVRSFSGTIRNESIKMRKEAQRIHAEQSDDVELKQTIDAQKAAEDHADAQLEADRRGIEIPDNADPVAVIAGLKAAKEQQANAAPAAEAVPA